MTSEEGNQDTKRESEEEITLTFRPLSMEDFTQAKNQVTTLSPSLKLKQIDAHLGNLHLNLLVLSFFLFQPRTPEM